LRNSVEPSSLLVVFGLLGFVSSGGFGLVAGGKLAATLRAVDAQLYSQQQLGLGPQLVFSFGSPESQRFIVKREYRSHPNATVRALGGRVHAALWLAITSSVLSVGGFVVHAVVR
jgi:hypothetical protein